MDVDALLAEIGAGDLATMRAGLDALAAAVSVRVPVAEVRDRVLDLGGRSIRVRSYSDGPDRPLLLWFHGGGYVSGTLDAIDPTCRQLARLAAVDVVSVDYRLAPEHRYPAALEDCVAVTEVLRPAAVGGDSAGGGLAAAVAQRVPGLRAQLLLCPWLDATLSSPSTREPALDGGLRRESLAAFAELYADDRSDPGVSPLLAPDVSAAPPAVIVTGGLDPLRDEAELYAARLHAAGVGAVVRQWPDQPHGFPGMTAVTPAAEESLRWAADQLRDLL